MSTDTVTLGLEAADTIRRMLLVGLYSYGEVERLADAAELRRNLNQEVPDELAPVPIGTIETSSFAEALLMLDEGYPEGRE